MLSKLWGWVVAAGAVLVAALFFVVGQRDRAKAKLKQVKVDKAAVEASRSVEQAVTKAQADARRETNDTRKEHSSRPDSKRPDGDFRR